MTVAIDTAGHDQSASRVDILPASRKLPADGNDASVDNADIADKIVSRGDHSAISDGQVKFAHRVAPPTVLLAATCTGLPGEAISADSIVRATINVSGGPGDSRP